MASNVENLQVAQVLADLNELQHASDPSAALALLELPPSLPPKQNTSIRRSASSTPLNKPLNTISNNEATSSPSTPRPSHAARLRTESSATLPAQTSKRPSISTTSSFKGKETSTSTSSPLPSTLGDNQPTDPHLLRAYELLTLHSNLPSLIHPPPARTHSTTSSSTPPSLTSSSTLSTISPTPSFVTNPWAKPQKHGPPSSFVTNPWAQPKRQNLSATSTWMSPTSLRRERQDVEAVAQHYARLRDMEMGRDPVGMRGVLGELEVPVSDGGR